MKVQQILSYQSVNNNKSKGSSVVNPLNNKNSHFPSFGVGIRGALIESISEGQKVLDLSEKSSELNDMAERFHTCPEKIVRRVCNVYEWSSLWALLGLKDLNEAKSQVAYQKLSGKIQKVIDSKPQMAPKQIEELNAKAKKCYDEYNLYLNI